MIELGACEIAGFFGPMASGKTYLIETLLKTSHHRNRYVRFDATGETLDDPSVEHIWQSPLALWRRLKANPYLFRIAYHPGENLEEDFRYVIACMWRLDVVSLIVVDEFHEVCSVNETPKYVRTLLRYARHDHLALIGASQRIADVHKLYTAGCRQTVLFFTQESRDLGAISDRWGRSTADLVSDLRPLIYDDAKKITLQIPQCVVIQRGFKPRVYDFAEGRYLGAGQTSTQDENEIQRQDTSSAAELESGEENPGNVGEPEDAAS